MTNSTSITKSKRVGFNFFRSFTVVEGKYEFLDLSDLFETIRTKYDTEKSKPDSNTREWKHVYSYNREPARLSDITIDHDTGYYHLVFERLGYTVPVYTTLHGQSKAIELEDDEFIGHEVNMMYDPENHIIMIQRNKDSLGPSGIEQFLRSLITASGVAENFTLSIVTDTKAKSRAFNQAAYRKIQVKVTGTSARGLLEKLSERNVDGVDSVEIILSTNSKRNSKIDNEFSQEVLQKYTNNGDVSVLRVRAKEEEDSSVEPIDLINHKLVAYFSFSFGKGRTLDSDIVFNEMVRLYLQDGNGGFKKKILRA